MSIQVESAIQSEGVGNSNPVFTLIKKVSINDYTNYEEGKSNNGGKYATYEKYYYFRGQHEGVLTFFRLGFEGNSSEFFTNSDGFICDPSDCVTLTITDTDIPLSRVVQRYGSHWEDQEVSLADVATKVNALEVFFAKDCELNLNADGETTRSWKFADNDFYHQ